MKLCNSFQRNTEIIAVRFEELCSCFPTLISSWAILWCLSSLLPKVWTGLSGPTWRMGSTVVAMSMCVCSMSTRDGNEFWETSFLKIARARGSHLLGNLPLYYETIMCCDYSSDKGNQRCCQVVSAEVFQHGRTSLCSSWLWLVFMSRLRHWDGSPCAAVHWRMRGEGWGMRAAWLCMSSTVCWSCGQSQSVMALVSQMKLRSSSLP